ncbi:MAG TPA: hypothetical protein VK728_06680 [Candidatus Sulfotelmatobacter sp.]|jgi:hypothetical protein|nr:hypothetical protein [Candidatus Sulfotelmatobacter sp.]
MPVFSELGVIRALSSERGKSRLLIVFFVAASLSLLLFSSIRPQAAAFTQDAQGPFRGQSQEEATAKSTGCMSCHTTTDEPTMHPSKGVHLGCTDCHGGNNSVVVAAGVAPTSPEYQGAKEKAHVQPRDSFFRNRTTLPEGAYTQWLKESPEFVKFINPGDLRVAPETCGTAGCHPNEVRAVSTNMMTHSGFLWGAALYNNGGIPFKNTRFGESYDRNGKPQEMKTIPPPTPEETRAKGVLAELTPLYRWEISQPGNVLRVFERGGEKKAEIGNPSGEESPGKPDDKLSDRGFGTELRTDPVFLGLQKTRLLDPILSLPGTNDHAGDYRSSGCSACHVIYANDRDTAHSGPYAKYGHSGFSASVDPTIRKDEPGHPIKHTFTRAIPSSQCMICHIHPGTNMVTTYFGLTWWDNEIDGDKMYPPGQRNPSEEERYQIALKNPEAAAPRGLWGEDKFLEQTGSPEFNAKLKTTQFADFHGHGWVFRGVYNHDRKGNWLDKDGQPIAFDDPQKFQKAVHLADVHLEKGMQCADCHFAQDNHGNGKIYGEPRAAVEIDCVDCHGTIRQKATLVTSGPAAPDAPRAGEPRGRRLDALRTPDGLRRFEWRGDKLFQRSMTDANVEWEIVQTRDTITPGNSHFSMKSLRAKLMSKDGAALSQMPADDSQLAHANSSMTCYACHTSWTPTCFGCHLQMTANVRRPMLHNEGLMTRNYTSYNFQVLRDDAYFLGVDGTVTGHRIAPARSSCAVLVSSQNANREWLYYEQQTISAEGFSGQAFSTFVPHTVRAKETKQCSDCHVSAANDNNAWMAQVLLQGTNFMNFMGRYIFVATGKKGFEAITVAEHDEPEAIYGSDLQRIAYPDNYKKFVAGKRQLAAATEHEGTVFDIQARGEYAYTANGKGGMRVYDIANIDNKGFSEQMTTAPVSPIGQRFYVPTKNAVAVVTPTTLGVDPLRARVKENEEQAIHLLYGFLYVADKEEGLVVIGTPDLKAKSPGVGTLLDGNPANNFLKRGLTFNPGGILTGARRITIAGTFAYILTDKALVVVDLNNPLAPQVTATIAAPVLNDPRAVAIQFRYAFVADRDGLKVLDVTDLAQPKIVSGAMVPFEDARNVYVARTYAYVSAGKQGLAIVDVEKPEAPKLDQVFTANGQINDVNDVKIGMVAASAFAFVADGKNGMRVLQILSPWDDPAHFSGFNPRPTPKLIATAHMKGPALAISKGIDRDRAVDESGNQLAVFGRRGARPLNREETERLYLRKGDIYKVTDEEGGGPGATSARTSAAGWAEHFRAWLGGWY